MVPQLTLVPPKPQVHTCFTVRRLQHLLKHPSIAELAACFFMAVMLSPKKYFQLPKCTHPLFSKVIYNIAYSFRPPKVQQTLFLPSEMSEFLFPGPEIPTCLSPANLPAFPADFWRLIMRLAPLASYYFLVSFFIFHIREISFSLSFSPPFHTDWQKIFAHCKSDKALISKIQKALTKHNNRKKTQLHLKNGEKS